ncbi:MAG: FecR family protein [Gammaproteobacteria bacterium]|nr:FecR family protein [Gammaproteobacteria bacterium]MDH5777084.1 FecR family protein [Gammaproteobacteria bacterium]
MITLLNKRSFLRSLVCTLALLLMPLQYAHAHAGKVLFASGQVTVKSRKHNNTTLKRGSEIWAGDIIMTGKNGTIQIRTGDDSLISLKPNSKLIIEAHKHSGPEDEQYSSIEIVKGAMRAVTGLIGKNKPDNFRIKARGSTIGIRGTEFVVQVCERDECNLASEGQRRDPADNGVYVGVVSGAITVENNKKIVELDSSLNVVLGVSMGVSKNKYQYVYIEERNDDPVVLKEVPKILSKAMAPPGLKTKQKSRHTMKPYAGLDSAHIETHLAQTAPIDKPRSGLADFENLAYPSAPDVFKAWREVRGSYLGIDVSDGQEYNLTSGTPALTP